MTRVAKLSLLGLYLAASLMAGFAPHADGCATHVHAAGHDDHECQAPAFAQAQGDADDDCATCKFLGQRYLAPPADPEPEVERCVAAVVVSVASLDVQWPRSPHDPRGPPLG